MSLTELLPGVELNMVSPSKGRPGSLPSGQGRGGGEGGANIRPKCSWR